MTMMTSTHTFNTHTAALMDAAVAAVSALPDEGFVLGYDDGEFMDADTMDGVTLRHATVFEHKEDAMASGWFGDMTDRPDAAEIMTMAQAKNVALASANTMLMTVEALTGH
ncbi:hypothetical protein [uncultured Tateyamaria sp.]|uniref:hypothetical protein n=1 Tax=uncultured Tateyamaria sp. TaxID=455651 RepID=UPI002602B17F|nr:hypothetical protein [uncultured Tateyamaria sp.]